MGIRHMLGKVRRRLRSKRPRPSILMYHRVAALQHDPWGLAVAPDIFDQQMRYLREHRVPMSMDDLVQQLRRGTLPATAVGVTFDDAYLDNLVHAKPSLMRHSIPGTVFVPTGLIGRNVPFWWDELNTMILDHPGPHRSEQTCGKEQVTLQWDARERDDADPEWRGWEPPKTKRQTAYVALWSRMQKMSEAERAPVLASLRVSFAVNVDPLSLPMNQAQIEELLDGEMVRLGAHTVNHASLSDGTLEAGRTEIRESKAQCSLLASDAVQGFAYPYGNMTPEICQEVEAAGYAYGCAAEAGFLDDPGYGFYKLPRVPAPNVAGTAFAELLTG